MIATLTRSKGRWVALWRSEASEGAFLASDRQEAALALRSATGVWLGRGSAPLPPAASLDQALAALAEGGAR